MALASLAQAHATWYVEHEQLARQLLITHGKQSCAQKFFTPDMPRSTATVAPFFLPVRALPDRLIISCPDRRRYC